MTTDTTRTSTPPQSSMSPEPWWKNAPQGPPPRWASPAAVERMKQQREQAASATRG